MYPPTNRPHATPGSPTNRSTPVGISVAGGTTALMVATLVAAVLPASLARWRFPLIAAVVGGFAAVTLDQLALAGVAVLAALITNGFLENRMGELSWHGQGDTWRLIVLALVGTAGLAAGTGYRQLRDLRARWRAGREAQQMTTDFDEGEENRDG